MFLLENLFYCIHELISQMKLKYLEVYRHLID